MTAAYYASTFDTVVRVIALIIGGLSVPAFIVYTIKRDRRPAPALPPKPHASCTVTLPRQFIDWQDHADWF